jgi:hypothetical protein
MKHEKNGWVCDPHMCPRRVPESNNSYQVEKRYLTTARIMFLTSAKEDQDLKSLVKYLHQDLKS